MVHISIEGMDGVGKTTVSKMVAEKLGYVFAEKPLHYLIDEEGSYKNYQDLAIKINNNPDRDLTSWYYAFNNILLYNLFKDQNIVTDRHIVSNHCYSGTDYNQDVYDLLIKKIGLPTLTVILYARSEVIESRLKKRNINDNDLKKVKSSEEVYKRMVKFCEERRLNYILIDSSDLTLEEIVDKIVGGIHE